ncbi:MAG: bifunctional folylpolyglutamate synthase/dihydrofolate synthase, partial [Eubacterium sp.]|nr:bifunctional folylpolyglutamate synthase/dihydrofolate synthase [Eubacterium sp.]
MNYNEALSFIISKQSLGIMPGLTRILKLLEKMGNPQKDLKIIHIAGTNGKGTVAATIANTLTEHGYKIGLFSSPWVMDYREQIQINNAFISETEFADYVEKYKDNDCSEFEFLTAIMYKYFADNKVDYAVVECGMGGLEDATNVEESNIAVITSVALDHTAFLGNTIEEISYQKAGIIKDNGTCVLYPNPNTEHIFEKVCKEKNAKLIKLHDFQSCSHNNKNTVSQVLKLLDIHT